MTKTVTKKIFELMDGKGITAYRLSKETGISESVISRWKSGEQSPSLGNLIKLAKYFDCEVDDFTKGLIWMKS